MLSKKRWLTIAFVGATVMANLLIFVGCGPDQIQTLDRKTARANPTPTSLPHTDPDPSPTVIPNCLESLPTDTHYNACLFLKNPVYHQQAPFASRVIDDTDLRSNQTYAVRIDGLDDTGYLQNDSFSIQPVGISRLRAQPGGEWRYGYLTCDSMSRCSADQNHSVGQLMAYFWLNTLIKTMRTNTAKFYAADNAIAIRTQNLAFSDATYWDDEAREISLGFDNNQDQTLNGETVVKLMGLANFSYATRFLKGTDSIQHFCGSPQINSDICCNTSEGCLTAIESGQGDYYSAILFQGSGFGETLLNSLLGSNTCGVSHAPKNNKSLTRNQAFTACATKNGQKGVMGRLYASYWWEVRSRITSNPVEVDTLFTEHLQTLTATETFVSALQKIKAIDANLFQGKYSSAFDLEFSR